VLAVLSLLTVLALTLIRPHEDSEERLE
jgi:hypothetical protein